MDFDITSLLTPAGVAFVVGLVAQFLIKPGLKSKYGEEQKDKYRFIFNAIVIGLGAFLGLVASLILNNPATLVGAFTGFGVGLMGGFIAIGVAEPLGNYQKFRAS